MEHLDAQTLFVAFATRGYRNGRHDGADEPDLDRVYLFGFGNRSTRPRVFHLQQEVPLEGLRATERNQVVLGPGIALIELERELGFFVGVDRVDCLENFRRGERLVQWHVDVLEVRIDRFGRGFVFGTRDGRGESDQYEGEEIAQHKVPRVQVAIARGGRRHGRFGAAGPILADRLPLISHSDS